MNNDYLMVGGIVTGLFAFPSLLNAYSTGRPPRAAMLLLVAGVAMVSWVLVRQPNTYSIETLPDVFMRVVTSFTR
jgi:hypothetical protein